MRLLSLSDMHSRFLDVFSWCDSALFFFFFFPNCWITIYCLQAPLFSKAFTCWPISLLLQCIGICEWSSYQRLCAGLYVDLSLQLCVRLVASNSVTSWTEACWVPLPVEFSRQEHWSGVPFPTPRGSFWSKDRTHVCCISSIGRQILYH